MAILTEQRALRMRPEQFAALEALAVQTNSRSTRGPKARQHSWQCFIERIADGEIIVVEREPYSLPDGLDDAVRQLEETQRQEAERQAEQERLEEQRRRIAQHGKQAQKMPLKLEQLHMELEPA
jgi:hypothetical protein